MNIEHIGNCCEQMVEKGNLLVGLATSTKDRCDAVMNGTTTIEEVEIEVNHWVWNLAKGGGEIEKIGSNLVHNMR